jgi:respiratory burst oxidase
MALEETISKDCRVDASSMEFYCAVSEEPPKGIATPLKKTLLRTIRKPYTSCLWIVLYFLLNALAIFFHLQDLSIDAVVGYGVLVARGSAQVILLNAFLLLVPLCHSIIAWLRRVVPYLPPSQQLHHLPGIVLVVAAMVHTGAHASNLFYLSHIDNNTSTVFSAYRAAMPLEVTHDPWSWSAWRTLPMWTGVMLLLLLIGALPFLLSSSLRQRYYNLFWYTHILFLLPFLIILLFHGATSWLGRTQAYLYLLPPLIVLIVDRRFRYAKSMMAPAVPIHDVRYCPASSTLMIVLDRGLHDLRFLDLRPSMYVLVNVPLLARHQWHPFTLSSAPADPYLTIHLRIRGDWTTGLQTLLTQRPYPALYLDGPLRSIIDTRPYTTIVIIAGGLGITPFVSILRQRWHLPNAMMHQHVYLHWAAKTRHVAGLDTMLAVMAADIAPSVEMHQYITTLSLSELVISMQHPGYTVYAGRPAMGPILASVMNKHAGETIGVFSCGPSLMQKDVETWCHHLSYRQETRLVHHAERVSA